MHRVKPIEVHVLTCYSDVHVSLRLYVVSTAGFSCDVGCHIPKYLMTFTSKVLGFIFRFYFSSSKSTFETFFAMFVNIVEVLKTL